MNVFDAVGKFTADTSQLDQFIIKLEQGLTSASEKAAASTRVLKDAQLEFREAIKAVSAEGGATAENLARLADAEKNLALASAAAKEEHAALRTELAGTKESAGLAAEATSELTGKLASMFGLIAAAEGFKSLIEGTQKSVLGLELLSEKTGIAIDTLAGVQHVSEANGVAFDEVSSALTRLSRAQALAIEGGKQQVAAFERIGISATELKTLSPEQLFYRVADAMGKASSHAAESASAFALLGRGGAALIPIFQQGGDSLHKMVEEAAAASGVTTEAAQAAKNWEAQVANLTEQVRAGLIPVMELLIPIIKAAEGLGADTAMVIRDIASAIGGMVLAEVEGLQGIGKVMDDLTAGEFKKAGADAKQMAEDVTNDIGGIGEQFKMNWAKDAESIKQIWKEADPLKKAKEDLSELGKGPGDKQGSAILAAQASVGKAVLELLKEQAIERVNVEEEGYSLENAASKEAYSQQLLALTTLELQKRAIEAQAAEDEYQLEVSTKQAQLKVLQEKGSATAAEQIKLGAEIEKMQVDHQAKLVSIAAAGIAALRKTMSEPIPLINEVPPGTDQIENEITKGFKNAQDAAQSLGITLQSDLGDSLQKTFDNYSKLETLFKQGIITQHDLDNAQKQVIQAQLQYAVATGASEKSVEVLKSQLRDVITQELAWARATHASTQEIKELQKELADLDGKGKKSLKDFSSELQHDMQSGADSMVLLKDTGKAAMEDLTLAVGDAFAAMITGQDTFGEAMLHGTEKMIGGLAQKWAMYFAAKGIADIMTPGMQATGAAELAAAVALEAVAGVMNALGSATSSKSTSASTGTAGPAAGSPAATAGSSPTQGRNTTHLGTGGIVSEPTQAIVGDDQAQPQSGAREAILPLEDRRAMDMVAAALAPAIAKLMPEGKDIAFPPIFNGATIAAAKGGMPAQAAALLSPGTIAAVPHSGMTDAQQHSSDSGSSQKFINDLMHSVLAPFATRIMQQGKQQPAQAVHIKIEADIPHTAKLIAPELSRQVNRGEVKLLASNSIRVTKRS